MRTATEAKQKKQKQEEDIADLMADAARKPRAKKKKASVKVISEVRKHKQKQEHRKLLPKPLLDEFVEAIRAKYPEARFNERGSIDAVLAHYFIEDPKSNINGWPAIVSTSGDKFYYDVDNKELFVGPDNRL